MSHVTSGQSFTTKKEGMGNIVAMLKGGTTSFALVLTQVLEVLGILNGGGAQKVSTL